MSKKLVLILVAATALVYSHSVFGQTTPEGQQRIVQSIIINGQQAEGVMVVQNGIVQDYTCASPQPYVTANQYESGWACFDQATGMWLLHARPSQTAYAYQQPSVYVQAPTTLTYGYYPYGYYGDPYSYYGYPYSYYPYFAGPRFGVGFGFGFGYRSPVIVNRPFIGRRIVPFGGRNIAPFGQRPFGGGGFRQARGGMAFGRAGRR
jgi:hypothetical protein